MIHQYLYLLSIKCLVDQSTYWYLDSYITALSVQFMTGLIIIITLVLSWNFIYIPEHDWNQSKRSVILFDTVYSEFKKMQLNIFSNNNQCLLRDMSAICICFCTSNCCVQFQYKKQIQLKVYTMLRLFSTSATM